MGRILGAGIEFHCISDAQQICPSRCCGVTGSHLVLVEWEEWEAQVLGVKSGVSSSMLTLVPRGQR